MHGGRVVKLRGAVVSKTLDLIQQLGRDEEGATLIEYTALLGILFAAVITMVWFTGGWVNMRWGLLSGELSLIGP